MSCRYSAYVRIVTLRAQLIDSVSILLDRCIVRCDAMYFPRVLYSRDGFVNENHGVIVHSAEIYSACYDQARSIV